MYHSCLEKQKNLFESFLLAESEATKYQKIMDMGQALIPLQEIEKTPAYLVKGCQSRTYLISRHEGGYMFFKAESDALISAGLAALLLAIYSGETPETVLKCAPTVLEQLNLGLLLTPSRANGLYSIHLRMKQDAIQLLLASA